MRSLDYYDVLRKGWNTVWREELFRSPGRMPHPNEGENALTMSAPYRDAEIFDGKDQETYAVEKQSAEKKKKTPFAPMEEFLMYGKASVRMNQSCMLSSRRVLFKAKGMTYTEEPL